MKCEFCEKEIEKDVKFCPFCGADLRTDKNPDIKPEEKQDKKQEKKNVKPLKIILIVFLCSAIIIGLVYLGGFLIFKAMFRDTAWDEFKNGNNYSFDEDDVDDVIDKFFSKYFDDEDDTTIVDEREYKGRYDDYAGVENFKAGKITRETNSYESDFINLAFDLPTAWDIYTDKELDKLYSSEGSSKALANNKLFVYDLYAENSLSGDSIYISFYNKDYFSEYKNLDEFSVAVKDSTNAYASKYDVSYADDSTITINGDKYVQTACRISDSSTSCYQYDFVRDLGEYYVDISIFAYDLDTVGSLIDILNSKG